MLTNDTMHTACCLWEAALEALNEGEKMERMDTRTTSLWNFGRAMHSYRLNHGTCHMRQVVAEMAPACDAAWSALSYDEQDAEGCFDWEFCPKYLRKHFFNLNQGGHVT